ERQAGVAGIDARAEVLPRTLLPRKHAGFGVEVANVADGAVGVVVADDPAEADLFVAVHRPVFVAADVDGLLVSAVDLRVQDRAHVPGLGGEAHEAVVADVVVARSEEAARTAAHDRLKPGNGLGEHTDPLAVVADLSVGTVIVAEGARVRAGLAVRLAYRRQLV